MFYRIKVVNQAGIVASELTKESSAFRSTPELLWLRRNCAHA